MKAMIRRTKFYINNEDIAAKRAEELRTKLSLFKDVTLEDVYKIFGNPETKDPGKNDIVTSNVSDIVVHYDSDEMSYYIEVMTKKKGVIYHVNKRFNKKNGNFS